MEHVTTTWISDMGFDSFVTGHHVIMDTNAEFGGKDRGPRPKMLLLSALGGCTGMDVISILKKMKVEVEEFKVTAQTEVSQEHPKVFTKIHIIYDFKGKNLPEDKLKKAVELSQEKYCAVSAMLKKTAPLTYEIRRNG